MSGVSAVRTLKATATAAPAPMSVNNARAKLNAKINAAATHITRVNEHAAYGSYGAAQQSPVFKNVESAVNQLKAAQVKKNNRKSRKSKSRKSKKTRRTKA